MSNEDLSKPDKQPETTDSRLLPETYQLVRERWNLISEEDLQKIEGRRDRLTDLVRERYNLTPEEARRQVDDLEKPKGPKKKG